MPRPSRPRITHSKNKTTRSSKVHHKESPEQLSWDDAVRRFHDHLIGPAEASRHTIRRYSRELEAFRRWWRADSARDDCELSPAAVLASDLRDFKDWLRTEPISKGTIHERTRKAGAVNAALAPLNSFLGWCERAGIIAKAPEMPKRIQVTLQPKAISLRDQKRLYRAIERDQSKRDMAILLVLLDCGLRVAELCALRWKDVRLTRGSSELYIWHGKGDKEGRVPLSSRARRALLDLRGDQQLADAPVFASRKAGRAITPRGVQNLFERYGRVLGLHLSPHQCRHSCATDMLDRGVQVPTVQAVLRHRSVTTTLGYCRSSPERAREAVERERKDE